MNLHWNLSAFGLASCLALSSGTAASSQETQPAVVKKGSPSAIVAVGKITHSAARNNGLEVKSGPIVLLVTALRDDILRVRIANGSLPEDASWAVLPQSRISSVPVTQEQDGESIGFQTKALRVRVNRATSQLRITDLSGNVIEEDDPNRPIEFHGTAFRVYKTMPAEEHYFGLGDKPGPLDRRGGAYSMWNTDWFNFQESTDTIYKSIPFFLSLFRGRASGTLFDNHWRSNFDFGKESHTAYSFGAENGPLDYYVLYGPDAKQVMEEYAWLTGPTPLPPLWSFGFQQSRFSYIPEARVREIANRLREDRIPSDSIYLDIDFQDRHRPFTVDREKFPRFEQMIEDLKRQNFHVVAITDLHIASAPLENYAPYDNGVAGDHFVKNPDGTMYVGKVWPGPSVFPDFTRKQTRDWWGTLYKPLLKTGVAGFWNDMNEPSIFDSPTLTMPEDVQHRIDEPGMACRVATHAEIHNIFGLENSRATYEGLRKLQPDVRPFVLTRASYAGGQRYAATWTGDNSSTWNHLRLTTPMLLNLGLSGFGMTGADVGGFIGTPSPDLLTKWIELATFQPIDRDHTNEHTADQEVWVHGPEQEAIRRRYIEERYKLMPYLYTTAEEMSRTGIPIVRPLFMEFPRATADLHPIDLDGQGEFLFGRDLLVAPSPFPDRLEDYVVRLPSTTWYDYWTGEKIAGHAAENGKKMEATSVTIQPKLDVLPVFVREGAIVPMQPLVQSTNEVPNGPLTLRVYPGRDCHGSLYQDDGTSFAYECGDFLRVEFSCMQDEDSLTLHVGSRMGSHTAWWKELQVEVYGATKLPKSVTLATREISRQATYDSMHHAVSFTLADDGKATDVRIEWTR
jgi:alpha-glucosidase